MIQATGRNGELLSGGEAARRILEIILSTSRGSHHMRPDLGSRIAELLHGTAGNSEMDALAVFAVNEAMAQVNDLRLLKVRPKMEGSILFVSLELEDLTTGDVVQLNDLEVRT